MTFVGLIGVVMSKFSRQTRVVVLFAAALRYSNKTDTPNAALLTTSGFSSVQFKWYLRARARP